MAFPGADSKIYLKEKRRLKFSFRGSKGRFKCSFIFIPLALSSWGVGRGERIGFFKYIFREPGFLKHFWCLARFFNIREIIHRASEFYFFLKYNFCPPCRKGTFCPAFFWYSLNWNDDERRSREKFVYEWSI